MAKGKKDHRYGRDAPAEFRTASAIAMTSPDQWKILCGDGYRPIMQCPEVQICINVYAELISSMTLRLMRNTEKGDIRVKNELSRLLDIEPNRHMTHMAFFHVIVRALMENGNQVTLPVMRNGYLDELKPLRPSETFIEPKGLDDYEIIYRGARYSPDEVLHFILNPDPDQPWKGQGYQVSLKDIVKSIRQSNAH